VPVRWYMFTPSSRANGSLCSWRGQVPGQADTPYSSEDALAGYCRAALAYLRRPVRERPASSPHERPPEDVASTEPRRRLVAMCCRCH